jgi:hypothetical protein
VGDHSLEDCPIVLEKVMNKRMVNILHIVPRKEVLNSNNIHVVTIYRVGLDNYMNRESLIQQLGNQSTYLNPDQEEKLMREALKFFKNIDHDKFIGSGGRQWNMSVIKDVVLDEFLHILKEKIVGRLTD